jgi:hypothetical protein
MQNEPKDGANNPASSATTAGIRKYRPLRTWPPVGLVALMLLFRFGPALLEGGMSSYWMLAVFVRVDKDKCIVEDFIMESDEAEQKDSMFVRAFCCFG